MTIFPIIAKTVYDETYHTLRNSILQIAQLDANVLKDAAIELGVDLEVYQAEQAKGPHVIVQAFAKQYDAFEAMLRDWFATTPWPDDVDSVLKGLQEFQFYLTLAWCENEVAYYLLSCNASDWDRQQAAQYGITAALSAQKAYFHALQILLNG